jgi:hypothetical protein
MRRPRRSTVLVVAQVAVAAAFAKLGVLLAGPPRPDAVWEWLLVCGLALAGGLCAVRVIGPALGAALSSDPRRVVQFAALGAALAFIEVDATVTGETRDSAHEIVGLVLRPQRRCHADVDALDATFRGIDDRSSLNAFSQAIHTMRDVPVPPGHNLLMAFLGVGTLRRK